MSVNINIHRAVGTVKFVKKSIQRDEGLGSSLHALIISIDTETNETHEIIIYSDEPLTLENSDA